MLLSQIDGDSASFRLNKFCNFFAVFGDRILRIQFAGINLIQAAEFLWTDVGHDDISAGPQMPAPVPEDAA